MPTSSLLQIQPVLLYESCVIVDVWNVARNHVLIDSSDSFLEFMVYRYSLFSANWLNLSTASWFFDWAKTSSHWFFSRSNLLIVGSHSILFAIQLACISMASWSRAVCLCSTTWLFWCMRTQWKWTTLEECSEQWRYTITLHCPCIRPENLQLGSFSSEQIHRLNDSKMIS